MPMLIPIGASIAGGLIGSRLGKKSASSSGGSSTSDDALKQLSVDATKQGMDWSKTMFGQGQNFLSDFGRSSGLLSNYWAPLLSGSRSAMLRSVSPEVNSIMSQMDNAFQTQNELTPRSGGGSSIFRNLPYQKAGQITNLLSTVRPQAYQGMFDLASNQAQLGAGLMSDAAGNMMKAPYATQGLLNYNLARRGQTMDLWSNLGSSIFGIVKMLQDKG